MKNNLLIRFTQVIPSMLGRSKKKLQNVFFKKKKAKVMHFLPDIDYFATEENKTKKALLMLSPSSWLQATIQYPNIRLYNNVGLSYSLVKALNLNGYAVDIIDYNCSHTLTKEYDLFVGHGGNCREVIDSLDPTTPIYQYVSGAYWKNSSREMDERLTRYYNKVKKQKPSDHSRSIEGLTEGMEYLANKADVMFTLRCPRMNKGYGDLEKKIIHTGLGAYLDDLFETDLSVKDFGAGMNHFIYVGGSGGNLIKGLDILLEAFAECPEQHLYIYCKVENAILEDYQHLLALPNIHYIYHWRYNIFHKKMEDLISKMNFSIHAPVNSGVGTAFSATMGAGLIPVGYIDLYDMEDAAMLASSCDVDSIIGVIRGASGKSAEWCDQAAKRSVEYYNEHCAPKRVEKNYIDMFAEVVKK